MTTRRQRREPEPGEFQDPLKNYDTPDPEDELERSLVQDTVEVMNIKPFKVIPPETTVEEAMRIMVQLDVACLMVERDQKLVGIFSERDILSKVAEHYETLRNRPVAEVMTPNPLKAYVTDSPATALNLMAVGGFRHVPIVDVDDRIVGILGPRRVTAYLQKTFA